MSSLLNARETSLAINAEEIGAQAGDPRDRFASRPLSLRSNFSWTFVGNLVYAGCQWGMLMVLAKLGSPELVGQFALGLAVSAPVVMFCNLQVRAIQATDVRREYRFGHYLALRIATTILALGVIGGISCGYPRRTALVILSIGLSKAFESLSDVFYGLMQARERMDRIALSMMIKGVASLVAMGLTVSLTGSVSGGALALAAVWALMLVAYDIPNGVQWLNRDETAMPNWEFLILSRLTRLALPLGFVMMLISLNASIPRYFIEHSRGERELGIFAALAYLTVVGNTVVTALGQSLSPRLARYHAEGDGRAFLRLLLKAVGVGIGVGGTGVLLALTAGVEILSALYRPEYASHIGLFRWLMVAATVSYAASFLGFGITAARKFRHQAPLFAATTLVTFAGCSALVPRYGLLGAAWSYLLASIVQLLGSVLILADLRRIAFRTIEQAREYRQ